MNTKPICRLVEGPEKRGRQLLMWYCPGCLCEHGVTLAPDPKGWEWNGSLDAPTVSPSVSIEFVRSTPPERRVICHFFIRDGRIEYCADCTHHLAGQNVAMRPVPDSDDQFWG